MIKSLFIEGSELTLEKPISVDDLLVDRPRLKLAKATLEARFKALGASDADAGAAATREMENFLTAALGKFGDSFVSGKRALLRKLVEIQSEIHGLYRDVMRGRGEVHLDIDALRGHYRDMQAVFDELGKPAEEVAASIAKAGGEVEGKPIEAAPTAVTADRRIATAEARFKTLATRKGFLPEIDPVTGKAFYRATLPKSGGVVDFFVEDGKFSVRSTRRGEPTTTFKEFDTLARYKDKPLSTAVMQAHHGCQSKLMTRLFGNKYDAAEAPTIWLRDSTGDSPHGLITHAIQNPREADRLEDPDISYGTVRDWAVDDLKAAGAPDTSIHEYLAAIDNYVKTQIEPTLTATEKAKLLGTIKVY